MFMAMAGAAAAQTGLIFAGAVFNAWILLVEIHR
jgi:hypothetical protein